MVLLEALENWFFLSTGIVTVFSIGSNASVFLGNYIIKKKTKYNGEVLADFDYAKRVYDEIASQELTFYGGNDLLPYINKLRLYFFENDLKIGIDNINNTTINRKRLMGLLGINGVYDSAKNEICYASKKNVGHEVLRMFSTTYDFDTSIFDSKNKITLSGFSQIKGALSIGEGINRGYTELLASRIFNKKGKVHCHFKEVKIASLLELFFDDPNDMANLYFSCNLPALIHHLESYAPREEIIKFIRDVDCLHKCEKSTIGPVPSVKYIQAHLTLYDWLISSNVKSEKIEKFEQLVSEDRLTSLLIKRQKMKLTKEKALEDEYTKNKVKEKKYLMESTKLDV